MNATPLKERSLTFDRTSLRSAAMTTIPLVLIAVVLGILASRGEHARRADVIPGESTPHVAPDKDAKADVPPAVPHVTVLDAEKAAAVIKRINDAAQTAYPYSATVEVTIRKERAGDKGSKIAPVTFRVAAENGKSWSIDDSHEGEDLIVLRSGDSVFASLPWEPRLYRLDRTGSENWSGDPLIIPGEYLIAEHLYGVDDSGENAWFSFHGGPENVPTFFVEVSTKTGMVERVLAQIIVKKESDRPFHVTVEQKTIAVKSGTADVLSLSGERRTAAEDVSSIVSTATLIPVKRK